MQHRIFVLAALFGSVTALMTTLMTTGARADITYADILADPDNPSLNQQFARQRLQSGDAKAALAAIERVLVAEPTNLGARLFRAEILAALGADLQADGELRALAALPLPADIKARVDNLRAQLQSRRKRLKSQLNVGFGLQSNDNASNWPSDNNVLFQGAPLPASNPYTQERFNDTDNPITEKISDEAVNASLFLTSSYDLGREDFRDVFVAIGQAVSAESDSVYLDNETGSLSFGLNYKSGAFSVTPRLGATRVENDFEDRLGNYDIASASLGMAWQVNPQQRLSLSLGGTQLGFDDAKKTNDTLTHSASLSYAVTLPGGVLVSLGAFDQDVDSRANRDLDKKLTGASLTARFSLARGQFLTLGGSLTEAKHDNAYSQSISTDDPVGEKRADDITNLNAGYLLLGGALSPQLNNWFAGLNYQANETDSNILGFSQKRNIVSLNINYALNF